MAQPNPRITHAILKILSQSNGPLGASRVAAALSGMGHAMQPRTVRMHLLQLDRANLTELVSRRLGRIITGAGRDYLVRSPIHGRLEFISTRMQELCYAMTLRMGMNSGTVPVNVTLIRRGDFSRVLAEIRPYFSRSLGMGCCLAVAREGECLAGVEVPVGYAGLASVSNVGIVGILQHEGITAVPRFGCLVEMQGRTPSRVAATMHYYGCSIEPCAMYIHAGMTSVRTMAGSGTGLIPASIVEVPGIAVDQVRGYMREIKNMKIGRILQVGIPGSPMLELNLSAGSAGVLMSSGFDFLAVACEVGIQVRLIPLAGVYEYAEMKSIDEVRRDAWRR